MQVRCFWLTWAYLCRLADLFNDEMESWHHEILSRVETTEDRKNKIRERAYALKARK